MNEESDRLSSLSDDLIHKILSYIDTKHAIKTSILSSRWKNTWKSIPHLVFSIHDHNSILKFSKSLYRALLSRNYEIDLSSVKLSFHEVVSQAFLENIMNYSFSHNVQKMTIICSHNGYDIEFPPSLFSSQSLKDLTLIGLDIMITSPWHLLALTTLHLESVFISGENAIEFGGLFSMCPNLKSLSLTTCHIRGRNGFTISHSHLSNLTLENGLYNVVNVVAPHLKNLTVLNSLGDHMISAPELTSLRYESNYDYDFFADCLSSLEKVDFYIHKPYSPNPHKIIDMLQQICNVKFLTIGWEIVEVLASNVQLVSHLPSPFANLMSFKSYPTNLDDEFPGLTLRSLLSRMNEEGPKRINMPLEVKNYLLNGSPSATLTILSREEVQAFKNEASAQQLMARLQMLLEQYKIDCETHIANMNEQDKSKALMVRHKVYMNEQKETHIIDEDQLVIEEILQISNCWNDLYKQIKQEHFKFYNIYIMLRDVERLLINIPTSKKDEIQAHFSSLRAEAYRVTKLIVRSNVAFVSASAFMNL